MPRSVKVPRASIACTVLRDPEYLTMMLQNPKTGAEAMWSFVALLCAAKDADNGGVFTCHSGVVSALTGIPLGQMEAALDVLHRFGFVVWNEGITIKNYVKWNPKDNRGGQRDGAGRPVDNQNNQNNQTVIKEESNGIQNVPSPSPSPSPSPNPLKTNTPPSGGYPIEFEDWWTCYPKKTGKGAAFKAWKKAPPHGRLVASLAPQAFEWQTWPADRRQFIPNPATWLHQARYDDEVEKAPVGVSPASPRRSGPMGLKEGHAQGQRILERFEQERRALTDDL